MESYQLDTDVQIVIIEIHSGDRTVTTVQGLIDGNGLEPMLEVLTSIARNIPHILKTGSGPVEIRRLWQ